MENRTKSIRTLIAIVCIIAMMSMVFVGCGSKKPAEDTVEKEKNSTETSSKVEEEKDADDEETESEEPYKITFMTQFFGTENSPDPMPDDSPVIKQLEEYTNTELDMIWVQSTVYGDKLNVTLASGELPMIILIPEKTPSIINAARSGAFWEVGPYLADYPNLSQANDIVLNNISIDGKVYAVYRARDLGRHGIVYRKDWLDAIGMTELKTIDDFYEMLKGFTYDDPDQNGQDDTYGMVVVNPSQYDGTFNIMLTWFGGPNGWEEDDNGELIPAHLTDAYMECMKFWKKMYDEKLINQDFAVYDPGKWDDPYVANKAGVKVDVCDTAGRWEKSFEDAGIDAKIDVIGAVEGPKGLRTLPTSGYNGMFAITKSGVKTEEDLKRVLKFLDQLNDKEMQDLLGWGIEDRHYTIVDGEIEPISDLETSLAAELEGANQMLMYIPDIGTPRIRTEVRRLQEKIIQENESIVVANPAEPLVSDVYAQKGPQLDDIIIDAKVKYIVGQIDEQGFQDAIELWRKSGGNDYIEEINKLYKEIKQ